MARRKHNGSDPKRPRCGCTCWDCRAERASMRARREDLKVLLNRALWSEWKFVNDPNPPLNALAIVRESKRLFRKAQKYGGFLEPDNAYRATFDGQYVAIPTDQLV